MKRVSFMIAFFAWMAVFFWACTFDIRISENRIMWAVIFATLWGIVVYFGTKELTKKFQ